MIELVLNQQHVTTDASPDTPLLWVIRDHFKLKGTKFGCGKGLCGACTVHIDGVASRSCVLPLSAVQNRSITTIEGIGTPDTMHPLQQTWTTLGVPQCGYCQSGQIMSAAALLSNNPSPSAEEIDSAMAGNLCRCGAYPKVKAAISQLAYDAAVANTEAGSSSDE